jgi:hypothetical protein
MGNDLIKQDINFMENPLWVLSEHPQKELRITNDRGEFLITSGQKLPERIDMIFLLYLLKISQKSGYVQKLELTRYEILTECDLNRSEINYERLEESLNRWKFVGIKFKGTFYDNREYLTKAFGIINEYAIDKNTKKLKIEFSKSFLEMVKGTNYCKFIDFKKYIRLRKPVACRLYELLLKTFLNRQEWEIEAMKLAQKLTLGEGGKKKLYPADIKIKIDPAVNEINEKTELRIELETRKNENKQVIFRFKLIKNIEIEKQESENNELQLLIEMLKDEYKDSKGLQYYLKRYYLKNGYDYVKYNIMYANKKASRAYVGFLKSALEENWGNELRLENEKQQKQKELEQNENTIRAKEDEESRVKDEQAYKHHHSIADFVNSLEPWEKESFINSVMEYLQGKAEFVIAKMALKNNPVIKPVTVSMFFDAFNTCYNSYMQLNRLNPEDVI